MDKTLQRILGVLLLLTLILTGSSLQLRFKNEAQNKTVLTVIDYREFWKSSHRSHRDMAATLTALKENGVHSVALKEMSLGDLAYNGAITLLPYGDFLGMTSNMSAHIMPALHTAIGEQNISPVSLTAISSNPELSTLLKQRLGARFSAEELIHFYADGKDYFIINCELNPLEKTKGASPDLDAQIGFDESLLAELKGQGFELVLRPGLNMGSNKAYLKEYEALIAQYDIPYVVFGTAVLNGEPQQVSLMQDIVDKYKLIVGVIETPEQIMYIPQKGLDELIEKTHYPINRVYSSSNDDFVKTTDERYYRWVRAIIDRGIRILYVVPFKDTSLNISENLDDTIEVIGHFHNTIENKGFIIDQGLTRLNPEMPDKLNRLFICLSLLWAGLMYLNYLFKPSRKTILALMGIGVVLSLAANLGLNTEWSKLYALTAAILYPSLSSMILLIYLRDYRTAPFVKKLLTSLAIILGVNGLGMYTVVSSLADIRYIMNLKTFSGVKLSFLIPLMLFMLNYLICFKEEENLLITIYNKLQKQPTYLVLLTMGIGVVALYIYLGRSGNTSGIQVSSLEIRMREILENIFVARPRFKEMIIGYPCLFMMVYLYHRYKANFILLILGLGVVMGSISMVNSFCHVFTAISISFNRTLAGLLIGIPLGLGAILMLYILEHLYYRYVA